MRFGRVKLPQTAYEKLKQYNLTLTDEEREYLLKILLKKKNYPCYIIERKLYKDQDEYNKIMEIAIKSYLEDPISNFRRLHDKIDNNYRIKFINAIYSNDSNVETMLLNYFHYLTREERELFTKKLITSSRAFTIFNKSNRYNLIVRNLKPEEKQEAFINTLNTDVSTLVKNMLEISEDERKIVFNYVADKFKVNEIKYILDDLKSYKEESMYYNYIDENLKDRYESIILMFELQEAK